MSLFDLHGCQALVTGGTQGLGLAIVLEIANQHGASITLEDAHPGQAFPGLLVTLRFSTADQAAGE